jgi:hypothetical protein
MSSPKTQKDITGRRGAALSAEAGSVRAGFINRKPKSGFGEEYAQKQLSKQYLVKGRLCGGGRVWDVFELDGFAEPKVVGCDFAWQEEAIAYARDKSLGRMCVSFGGLRGVFRRGSGGVLSTDTTIELPGKASVPVKSTRQGVIVG